MQNTIIDKETGEILNATGGELTVQDRAKLALRGNDAELIALAESTKTLVKIDTQDDYTEIKTAETVLLKTRQNILAVGKIARDDATKFSKAVIAEENRLLGIISPEELRLKALRHDWDEAIRIEAGRAHAEAEILRIKYENVVKVLTFNLEFGATADDIEARINQCDSVVLDDLDFLTATQKVELGLLQLRSINAFNSALKQTKEMDEARLAKKRLDEINSAEVDKQLAEKREKEDSERKLVNAPDSEKLLNLANSFKQIQMPVMSTESGQELKIAFIDELSELVVRLVVAANKLVD